MANIFHIDAADKSIYYLSQIFGSVGSVLPGTQSVFMSSLFLAINTIALTVGAVIVVYTTVVGLMMTAHEGEFLGKKWSGLWVPIRMVAGVASLFPAASGYSMIQVVIMWIIVQGVGAADTLWSAAVLSSYGGAVSLQSDLSVAGATTSTIGVNTQMKSLFSSLVCEATYKIKPSLPASAIYPEISLKNDNTTNNFLLDSTSFQMGPSGVCGVLTKCSTTDQCTDASSGVCALCTTQNNTLGGIVALFRLYAAAFAQADSDYLVFYYTANKPPPFGTRATGWMKTYCDKQDPPLTVQDLNATCCVAPSASEVPPYCLPDTSTPTGTRSFPKPFQDAGRPSNGMSIGSGSELEWVESWSFLPALVHKDPPLTIATLSKDDFANADFITQAAKAYMDSLTTVASTLSKPAISDSDKFNPTDAINQGWITAGAYFYQLVNLATKTMSASMMPLSVSMPKDEVMQAKYRSNYSAAMDFLQAISANRGVGGGGGSSGTNSGVGSGASSQLPGSTGLDAPLNDVTGTLSQSFMSMLQGAAAANPGIHDTPLLRIATFGQNLLIIAQLFYVLLILVSSIAAGLLAFATFVTLGIGNLTAPLEIYKAVTNVLYPALYLLLGALMTMGALLGMYVPMIPYVVFTASVIGWLIAVVEAMVAAPIIALGILSPGGQSEVFGRAEPSVMIIFNLFLRPTLMVFGLLVASFVANVVIKFICMGFQYAMRDVMTQLPGLVEEIIFIAIFASIIFTSMNQVFTLIHHIPERILTYIGGQAMQFGEGQAAQAMKGAVEGAAGGLAAAGKGTAEGVEKEAQALGARAVKQGKGKGKAGGKMEIEG